MNFVAMPLIKRLSLVSLMLLTSSVFAVTSVNPTGVNVSTTGATSVFLTFQGTAGQQPVEAFWCGEITTAANTVSTTNPCVPGTVFGFLPQQFNLVQSGTGVASDNTTDIMTIPPSISRKALQSAQSGDRSSFFYVRRFEANGVSEFIAVTCRLAGGGARVPLSLTEVRTWFSTEQGKQPVHLVAINEPLPKIGATIHYNGSGRLKGRWELVKPADALPEPFDLLPEASLPVEQRHLQKRYSLIRTVDVFLPPTGKIDIAGPTDKEIPRSLIGPYQLLLRIEATRDKEGDSVIANGGTDNGSGTSRTVFSGGVAGFSLPPLRFYVASEADAIAAKQSVGLVETINLLQPEKNTGNYVFRWKNIVGVSLYKLEIDIAGELFSAYHENGGTGYQLPPWVNEKLATNNELRWRVKAIDSDGNTRAQSQWQPFTSSEDK